MVVSSIANVILRLFIFCMINLKVLNLSVVLISASPYVSTVIFLKPRADGKKRDPAALQKAEPGYSCLFLQKHPQAL